MTVRRPLVRPEHPRPAIARPIISMVEEFAAPQMAEPISKRRKKASNVH
jgi:hypothetical protein